MTTEEKQINSYLTFKLGNELFAAHVGKVLNILELTRITEVPKAPAYMKGVINLRGSVLPVVDTRIKFNMSPTQFSKNTCIIVMNLNIDGEEVELGALVDSVQEVIEIQKDQIKAPPSIGAKYKSEFIIGMIKLDEQFVMLLNIDKVFSSDDIIQIQESSTEKEFAEQEDNA